MTRLREPLGYYPGKAQGHNFRLRQCVSIHKEQHRDMTQSLYIGSKQIVWRTIVCGGLKQVYMGLGWTGTD